MVGQERYDFSMKFNDVEYLRTLSTEDLKKYLKLCKENMAFFDMMQLVTKVLCNSVYGGFGTPSLRYFEQAVAEDITGEGRHYCKLCDVKANEWFKTEWVTDMEWFSKLKNKFPDLIKVDKAKPVEGDICVYSDTDSSISTTLLTTSKGIKTIEEVFNMSKYSRKDIKGNEFAKFDGDILNWTKDNKLYYAKPKEIIRHKVTKKRWKVKTKSGKEIIITGDHSMVVFRDGKQLTVKPSEINLKTDKILTVYTNIPHNINVDDLEYQFEEIVLCEEDGMFEDEYVYDIEMEDMSHTFIANDMLVHNSNYLTFDKVFESLDIDYEKLHPKVAVDFIEFFCREKLDIFYDDLLKKHISARNGNSTMIFELETIGGFGIFVAKKKYIFSKLWEDGKYVASQGKLKSTGIEIIQSSTSDFVKDTIKAFVNFIFSKRGKISPQQFFNLCSSLAKKLETVETVDICKSQKLNNYEKYVKNDVDVIEFHKIPMVDKKTGQVKPNKFATIPGHIRAAARYNHLVHTNNLQGKYALLKSGTRCKIYYDTQGQAFAFHEDAFPEEIAPTICRKTQMEKLIFAPIKRLVSGDQMVNGKKVTGKGMIDGNLDTMGSSKVQQGFGSMFKKK